MRRAIRRLRSLRGWKAVVVYVVIGVALGYGLRYGLGFILGTPDPVVTVISESMYPYYNVGDVLLVVGVPYREIKPGDVIVYRLPGRSVPVVHRVIAKTPKGVVTKGDNNPLPDPWSPVPPKYISGKVVFRIPYVGYPKALLDRYLYGAG